MGVTKFLLPEWGVTILSTSIFHKFGTHSLPKKMIAPKPNLVSVIVRVKISVWVRV